MISMVVAFMTTLGLIAELILLNADRNRRRGSCGQAPLRSPRSASRLTTGSTALAPAPAPASFFTPTGRERSRARVSPLDQILNRNPERRRVGKHGGTCASGATSIRPAAQAPSGSPAGFPAEPPQIRTCRFPASGSSRNRFATCRIDARCGAAEAVAASADGACAATRSLAESDARAPSSRWLSGGARSD